MGSSGGIIDEGGGGVTGPETSTDNATTRFDGTNGRVLQSSPVVISDAGAVSGVTLLAVDNLSFDGSTISSTSSNSDLTLAPNGTGRVILSGRLALPNGSAASPGLIFNHTGGVNAGAYYDTASNSWILEINTEPRLAFGIGDYIINLSAATHLRWASVGDATNNGWDVGEKRLAAGVLLDTNGAAGLGARLTGRVVEASIAGSGAPNLLAATESRKLLTNEGATAEAYISLPIGAPIGCEFQAYCADTDGIRITAPTGETIRTGPGSVSASAGFIKSVVIGSGITLVKINATSWVSVNAPNGTWTVDS